MNTQDLRLIRRMAELMPLKDPIEEEKKTIDKVDFEKKITFITHRPISKEVVFYYLLHNKQIDFVKVFNAETVKDIYFGNHPDYKSFHEVLVPMVVILLGKELYNKQMISILNIFSDLFLSNPYSKALIYVYEGSAVIFNRDYKNSDGRGILDTGRIITLNNSINSSSENRAIKVSDKQNAGTATILDF